MDMRCLSNLKRPTGRDEYIENRLDELIAYYHVLEEDRDRFFETPEIGKIKDALRWSDMNVVDIAEYLGDVFAQTWGRKGS